MAIGIIPIGLRDGYFKKNSSIGSTLIHGKRVSVLNGLHFEHTRIDLADLPEAGIGDKVVLIGKQADEEISLGEIVKFRGTDLHEICQSVRNHIPRIYFSVIVMRILDIIGSEDPSLWDLTDTASAT